MTRHLELAVKTVALMIGLLTIIVGAVSPVTGPPIPVDKMTSLDLTDLQHWFLCDDQCRPDRWHWLLVWHLWSSNYRHWSLEWRLQTLDCQHRSLKWSLPTLDCCHQLLEWSPWPLDCRHWSPKQCLRPLNRWLSDQMGEGKPLCVFEKYFTKISKVKHFTTFYKWFYNQWKIFYKFDYILSAKKI